MRKRVDALLTFKRARTYACICVGLFTVAWCDVVGVLHRLSSVFLPQFADMFPRGSPPLNSLGVPITGDYIAFHAAGRLLLLGRGAEMYDHSAVSAIQASLLDQRVAGFYDAFRNPPFAALPFVPLAELDLMPGFAIWTLVSLGCLGLSLKLLLDDAPGLKARWRGLVLVVLGFAPVYFGLIDGQNGTVSLLLYVLTYRALVRDQARMAGVWAALGFFKPQLFVVFPLVFLVRRNWQALLSYGLAAIGLVAVSLALVGPSGIQAWLRILVEPESANATANAWRMASLRSFYNLLLPDQAPIAFGLYCASSLALLALLLWAWARRTVGLPALWTLTSLVAVLVDPHLVDYDLSVLVAAGVVSAVLAPQLRWWMVLLYGLAIFRVQVPVGGASAQLIVPVLGWCAYFVLRPIYGSSEQGALAATG